MARFVGFQILNSELLFLKKKKVTLRASPVRVLLRKSGQGWAKLSRLQSDSFLYLEAYHVQRRKNKAVSSTVKTNLPGAPWFSHEGPLVTGMPSVGVGSTHVGCGEADSRLWGTWGVGNVHGNGTIDSVKAQCPEAQPGSSEDASALALGPQGTYRHRACRLRGTHTGCSQPGGKDLHYMCWAKPRAPASPLRSQPWKRTHLSGERELGTAAPHAVVWSGSVTPGVSPRPGMSETHLGS